MLFKLVIFSTFILFTADLLEFASCFKGTKGEKCYNRNNKLLSILNLLCNSTQNSSIINRDACYGCFFRVGVLTAGGTMLNQLSQCANIYLANTSYAGCSVQLSNIVSGVIPTSPPTTGGCYTGYCQFVRCIRRINANVLIDNCLLENIARNLTSQQDRVNFYTNITSCVLARARCNSYNPITGELQSPNRYSAFLPNAGYLSNALQIAPNGDLRIFSYQSQQLGVSSTFCSTKSTLDQAGYGVTTC